MGEGQGGKGNAKHNFRKARAHAKKRARYRAKIFAIATTPNRDKAPLGRKMRKLADKGQLKYT